MKGGAEMLLSHEGTVIEAYLIAVKSGYDGSKELCEHEEAAKDSSIEQAKRERSEKIINIVNTISNLGVPPPFYSQVTSWNWLLNFAQFK